MSKVFLVTLASVLALGYFVLAGKLEQRTELRQKVRTAEVSGETGPSAAEQRAAAAGERLAGALGTGAEIRARVLRDLGEEFGPAESIDLESGAIVLIIDWSRLPALLSRVSSHPAGALETLQAMPGPTPDNCRVELRLDPPPIGLVPR